MTLFDPGPRIPAPGGSSADARRTVVRETLISAGVHPTTGLLLAGNGETCGTCDYATLLDYHSRGYWKCTAVPLTHGPASDVRKRWPACTKWKPTTRPLLGLTGEWEPLANHHPITVTYDGLTYPTVTHAYAAASTLDNATRLRIQQVRRPSTAAKLARKAERRPAWTASRDQVITAILNDKFTNPTLAELLRRTGRRPLQVDDPAWTGPHTPLGELLTRIRDHRSTRPSPPPPAATTERKHRP